MSNVAVTDKRGGVFEVVVTFVYGECDRLPYNALRKVNARIEQVQSGGIKATAEFNVRSEKEAANFVEVLDLFGEDGSFVHGSPAEPDVLTMETPPDEDEDSSGLPSATAGEMRGAASEDATAAPSPEGRKKASEPAPSSEARAEETGEEGEADDLEVESEEDVVLEEGADAEPELEVEDSTAAGDMAVLDSLAAGEDRTQMLARVAEVAGDAYTVDQVQSRLAHLLYARHKDEKSVASLMREQGWKKVTPKDVAKVVGKQ